MKIALCGPPRSGKSVLRERLKTALRRLDPTVYPYILTTNPDGEGAWYQEAYHHDAQAAQRMKVEAKRKWSPEHADLYASWVRNCQAPLTFLDLGGIVDDYNRRICATATHTILIAPEESALVPWRKFSEERRASGAGRIDQRLPWHRRPHSFGCTVSCHGTSAGTRRTGYAASGSRGTGKAHSGPHPGVELIRAAH